MTQDASQVLEPMRRLSVPLYLNEIAELAKLSRTRAIEAVYELEEKGLVQPVTWKAVRGPETWRTG